MTEQGASPNGFEQDKPGTADRTHAEATIEELRKRGGMFVEAVRATRMAMVLTDPTLPGDPIVFANRAFLDLSGYSMDEVLGQQPHFLNGPGTDPEDAARFSEILEADEDGVVETVQYAKDGRRFVASVLLSAFKDGEGRTANHFLSWMDVTRRVEAERDGDQLHEAWERLRESEERLRLIVENAEDYAIFTTDPTGTVTDWREGAEAVFGYSRKEMIGQDCDILFTPEDRAADVPNKERSTAAEYGKASDVRWHLCKDGHRVFIDGVSTALRHPDGGLIGFLKIGQDITERHAAGERQKLLLAELQHRVRNTLGMIRSMVRFTAQGHDDLDDYVGHLVGRLDSLSRTQQLLTRSSNARVDLHELVSDEMTAQAGGRSAYRIDGPEVALAPKAAEVLSLALHELVTNSVKYGALGDVRGSGNQVTVGWDVAQRDGHDWLDLRWREPTQQHSSATRQGFGTELITQRVPYELRGEATLEIGDREVAAHIAFPLANGPASLLETGAPRVAP